MLHRIVTLAIVAFLCVSFLAIRNHIVEHHGMDAEVIRLHKADFRATCRELAEVSRVRHTCRYAAPKDKPDPATCSIAEIEVTRRQRYLREAVGGRRLVERRIHNPVTRFVLSPTSRWLCSGDGSATFAW